MIRFVIYCVLIKVPNTPRQEQRAYECHAWGTTETFTNLVEEWVNYNNLTPPSVCINSYSKPTDFISKSQAP